MHQMFEIEKKKIIKQLNGERNSSASASTIDLAPFELPLENFPLT